MIKAFYDQVITELLSKKPGYSHISSDGRTLHCLGPSNLIIEFTGVNFNKLTEDEINEYVQTQIASLTK